MKKVFLYALGAALMLASCAREMTPGVNVPSAAPAPQGAITFGSGIIAETRAVTEVTASTLSASGFKVLGISSDGENFVNYIDNVQMTNQGNDTYYNPQAIYYWPSGQTVDFYAVNPSKSIVGTNGVATVAHTLDADRGFDLVVASAYGKDADDGKINMAFEHALSQVTLKLKSLDADADYKVTSVVFTAPKSGTYTIAQAGNSWTTLAAAADSTVFSGNMTTVNTTTSTQAGDTFIAFPGSSSVTVSWSTYVGGQLIANYTQSAELVLQKGKRNSFTLKLPNAAAANMELSLSVDDWADASEVELQMGPSASIPVAAAASETVTLPQMTLSPGTSMTVDWGDGSSDTYEYDVPKAVIQTNGTVTPEHTYAAAFDNKVKLYVAGSVSMTVPAAVAETIEVGDDQAVEVAEEAKVYTFAGLQIAPGPLYYNGSSYEIKDNWNYTSYNNVYGRAAGSTYFSFIDLGNIFEKEGFGMSDGDIENLLDPLNGWRLPTTSEWGDIVGETRSGSTVNGTVGKHYAGVFLTGVAHAESSSPFGLLLFPDGETIIGKTLVGMDDDLCGPTSMTLGELNAYLAQGCVFLPASGSYYGMDSNWEGGGSGGWYWYSSQFEENNAYHLSFGEAYLFAHYDDYKSGNCFSARLVKTIN